MSRGVRGGFIARGPAYRGRGARTASMARRRDISLDSEAVVRRAGNATTCRVRACSRRSGSSGACRGAARGSNLGRPRRARHGGAEGTEAASGQGGVLWVSPLRAEVGEARRARQGGPGRLGNGGGTAWRHGGTSGRGREVGDDHFAENPCLLSAFFFISVDRKSTRLNSSHAQ